MEFTPWHYKLPDIVREALIAGDRVSDDEFDQILPPIFERVSNVQWSSVRVARVIARMLKSTPHAHFVDLGCGIGKLCLLLAMITDLKISGIERRASLIQTAQKLAGENAPGQIDFILGDILELDWDAYDVLYLYNPFMEHKCARSSQSLIDANIELSRQAYDTYVNGCFEKLSRLREGQRVMTYHGYGGSFPETLQMIDSEKVGSGTLRLWST